MFNADFIVSLSLARHCLMSSDVFCPRSSALIYADCPSPSAWVDPAAKAHHTTDRESNQHIRIVGTHATRYRFKNGIV